MAHLPRSVKRAIMVGADLVMIPAAFYSAMSLRLGSFDHLGMTGLWPYAAVVLTALPLFVRLGLYRAVVRYIGGRAILAVLAGVSVSTLLMLLLDLVVEPRAIPFTALAIYWALALIYVAGSRSLVRHLFFSYGLKVRAPEQVAIYGAGEAGARLSTILRGGTDFEPVAFIDDKRAMQGNHINGVTVFGPRELPQLDSQSWGTSRAAGPAHCFAAATAGDSGVAGTAGHPRPVGAGTAGCHQRPGAH